MYFLVKFNKIGELEMMWAYFFPNRLYGYIAWWTYPPGPLKLSILPNTQLEYFQVEYFKKYSTFSIGFT